MVSTAYPCKARSSPTMGSVVHIVRQAHRTQLGGTSLWDPQMIPCEVLSSSVWCPQLIHLRCQVYPLWGSQCTHNESYCSSTLKPMAHVLWHPQFSVVKLTCHCHEANSWGTEYFIAYPLWSIRMAKVNKEIDKQYWRGCGRKGNTHSLLVGLQPRAATVEIRVEKS